MYTKNLKHLLMYVINLGLMVNSCYLCTRNLCASTIRTNN